MIFEDRRDAGKKLAKLLLHYHGDPRAIILALPRGGVPVAYEISHLLNVRMSLFVVRKLGFPGHEEYAMGAIASGGAIVFNREVFRSVHLPRAVMEQIIEKERSELERRERAYGVSSKNLSLASADVILVDDGLATGSTMRAAIKAVRSKDPARVVVAVPVAPPSTCEELKLLADELVCANTPSPFRGVGEWYADFTQTTDEEVRALLKLARSEHHAA